MLVFSSIDAIPDARLPAHLATYIEKLFASMLKAISNYNPEDDGYLVLVTPSDTDESMGERLGYKWKDGWEGVSYDESSRCFLTLILRNNQYGISIVIPDEPWLDLAIRERVNREMA